MVFQPLPPKREKYRPAPICLVTSFVSSPSNVCFFPFSFVNLVTDLLILIYLLKESDLVSFMFLFSNSAMSVVILIINFFLFLCLICTSFSSFLSCELRLLVLGFHYRN